MREKEREWCISFLFKTVVRIQGALHGLVLMIKAYFLLFIALVSLCGVCCDYLLPSWYLLRKLTFFPSFFKVTSGSCRSVKC